MTSSLEIDISAIPVIKRPLQVKVEFAKSNGIVKTIEGDVQYQLNDAILTGVKGEHWSIQRYKFDQNYQPVPPTPAGESGFYVKIPVVVWAKHLTKEMTVVVGWQDSPLKGKAGDWLLQYGPDDFGIVQNEIFVETYNILMRSEASLQNF